MKIFVDDIEVELVRKSVKNINLSILPPDGRVRVSAPHFVPEAKIREFVQAKADWIREKRADMTSRRPLRCEYREGDTLYVFGTPYRLSLSPASKRGSLTLYEGEIVIGAAEGEEAEHYYNEFLRKELFREIEFLLPIWEERTGLHPSSWSIKNMSSRWGSCNTVTGKINFALGLGQKTYEGIEYVILHELCHLHERGHGERFRALLDEYMPNWRDVKQKLNARNGDYDE